MKAVKTEKFIEVICENLQDKLNALITYPKFAFERKGVNGESILFFYI